MRSTSVPIFKKIKNGKGFCLGDLTWNDPWSLLFNCVFHVEQSVPEYDVRSTVHIKQLTNLDSVHGVVRSFELYLEHHFEVCWSISSIQPSYWWGHLYVWTFLPLFCMIDLETNNGLMSAARKLMMLNRLLIVPGVELERTMLNI